MPYMNMQYAHLEHTTSSTDDEPATKGEVRGIPS